MEQLRQGCPRNYVDSIDIRRNYDDFLGFFRHANDMTQTFATNENNDLYIGANGNLVIASGIEAVKQACQTAVKAQFHEMVYEYDSGMPDFTTVWVGVPNYGQYRAALTVTLEKVDGVLSVENVFISQDKNTLKYQATITTRYGSVTLNG